MATLLYESEDTISLQIKDFLTEQARAAITVFQGRYGSLVQAAAKAFDHANIQHGHYCTNGIYMSDGPDMYWNITHEAADTLTTMFGSINAQDPKVAEVAYREGRYDEKTVCVDKNNLFEALKTEGGRLEKFLHGVAKKQDNEMTDADRETFAGYAALQTLLQDEGLRKEYAALASEIETAAQRHEAAAAQLTELNEALKARQDAERFTHLVEAASPAR